MIRVCHMTSAHQPGDNRVFRKECRTLANAGYDVFYVVPDGENGDCDGVHIVNAGKKPASRLKRFTAMARRTYKVAKALDCDVYHFHDTELLPYGLKLAKAGKTVIFDSHECYPLLFLEKEYIPKFLRSAAAKIYKTYETYVAGYMAAVVFPATMDGVNYFEGRCRRTLMLDNLPELASFPAAIPERVDKEKTVGYIGRLSESRGITQLVLACHQAGVTLRLAGPITPAYQAQLESMPEYACVDYRGVLPYKEVPGFCGSITVGACVLMNIGQYCHMDNLATKVYEYLSMELPVILTDSRPARKLVEECGCGVCVNPDDVDGITRVIRELLSDPERAKEMGRAGRRAVLEKYNWEKEGEKLVELYRELTGGPSA